MRRSTLAARVLAHGIVLGGGVAQARITTLDLSRAGVPPNAEGSPFCVTAANLARPLPARSGRAR